MGIVSEQAAQFDALTCASPHRGRSMCEHLYKTRFLCDCIETAASLFFPGALAIDRFIVFVFHFRPKWSRWMQSSFEQRVFTEKCREKFPMYRFRHTFLFLFIRTLSVCAPANILNFEFLQKFVKHSNKQMKISERLYFRRRLSVVARHERHRLFYRKSSEEKWMK